MLLTVAPPTAFAQTIGQPLVEQREQNLNGVPQPKSKLDLKASFAKEIANVKAGALSAADLKRLEKERLESQATTQPKSGFSKQEKILAVVIVVAITAVAIVLVHNGVEPITRCEDDPSAPDCIR